MSNEDDEERVVCTVCVGEAFLKAAIKTAGIERECSFCHVVGPSITLEELAVRVGQAFETHYTRTSPDPDAFQSAMLRDPEGRYDWERDGEEVLWAIANAAELEEDLAQEVLDILSEQHADWDMAAAGDETEFHPDSYYERKGPNDIEFQLEWRDLERSLKMESRFFNKEAEALLARIFSGIADYRTRDGQAVIRDAGPSTDLSHFSRARVFQFEEKLTTGLEHPVRELGPPPAALALGGRMNARGVSLFYGSTGPDAALAEVRPPVGGRVLVGQFDVIRPLRLLDIDALQSVYVEGSIFDPAFIGRLELATFLASLSARMTLPVMPDDEPTEYLITQVIADYLASNAALDLDGLLYPAVQRAGAHQNVVLFRRASRVEPYDLPAGTTVSVHTSSWDEDGPSPDYVVSEDPPHPTPPAPGAPAPPFFPIFCDPFADPPDERLPALRLVMPSLQVHQVERITFKTVAYDVRRYRWEHPSKLTRGGAPAF